MNKSIETLADERIETAAHGIEEGMPVGSTGIDGRDHRGGRGREMKCLLQPGRETEMERETVPRAAGNQAERDARVEQGLSYFVHGAIPADSDDSIAAVGQRGTGEDSGVAWRGGDLERCLQAASRDEILDIRGQPGPATIAPGEGIKDEADFHTALVAEPDGP